MLTDQNRQVYLDNIRIFIVFTVVFYHAAAMYAYPLAFFWPIIDKAASSRVYETIFVIMSAYMMPCLLFIAALFIFPSLNKGTAWEYLKKRFYRLYVPVIVFLFCGADFCYYLCFKRINMAPATYADTFLNYVRGYVHLPLFYINDYKQISSAQFFEFMHTWFLTFLFFLTVIVVLLRLIFKGKESRPVEWVSRRKIIIQTMIFALATGFLFIAGHLINIRLGKAGSFWIILGKVVQFQGDLIWLFLPLFVFGLYVYKKGWLASDIGSWKMWGILAFIFIGTLFLLVHIIVMPVMEAVVKTLEHNLLMHDHLPMPVPADRSIHGAVFSCWLIAPMVCVFVLMFLLSFTKRFFNRPNIMTEFCSKHSINVYILHVVPVLILQNVLMNLSLLPIIKILLIATIVISACLWLSHRLIYPYPKIAIAFFVMLKLIALYAGFTFYYRALLILTVISFFGAVSELSWHLLTRRRMVLAR